TYRSRRVPTGPATVFANRLAGRILGSTADSTLTIRSLELGESSVGTRRDVAEHPACGRPMVERDVPVQLANRFIDVGTERGVQFLARACEPDTGAVGWKGLEQVRVGQRGDRPPRGLRGRSSRRRSSWR